MEPKNGSRNHSPQSSPPALRSPHTPSRPRELSAPPPLAEPLQASLHVESQHETLAQPIHVRQSIPAPAEPPLRVPALLLPRQEEPDDAFVLSDMETAAFEDDEESGIESDDDGDSSAEDGLHHGVGMGHPPACWAEVLLAIDDPLSLPETGEDSWQKDLQTHAPKLLDSTGTRLYFHWRQQGHGHEQALRNAVAGPGYLLLQQSNMLEEVQGLLKQTGFSDSPLSFPRLFANSSSAQKLGSGQTSDVWKVKVPHPETGELRNFAFKIAKPSVSVQGLVAGLEQESAFPELRAVLAFRVAQLLGQGGAGGVVGAAWPAMIDGCAGLLMELAEGEPDNDWQRTELEPGSELETRLRAMQPSLADPAVMRSTCHELGAQAIVVDETVFVDSVKDHPHSMLSQAEKAASPSYRRQCNAAHGMLYLVNPTDAHGENILVRREEGSLRITLIDLAESFASLSQVEVLKRIPSRLMKHAFHMVGMPAMADAQWASQLLAPDFEARLGMYAQLARPGLSVQEAGALLKRAGDLRLAIQSGQVPLLVGGDEVWLAPDQGDASSSLYVRNNARFKQ